MRDIKMACRDYSRHDVELESESENERREEKRRAAQKHEEETAEQKKSANAKTPGKPTDPSGSYYSCSPSEDEKEALPDKIDAADDKGDAGKEEQAEEHPKEANPKEAMPLPPPPPVPPQPRGQPTRPDAGAEEQKDAGGTGGKAEGVRCQVCNKWLRNGDAAVRAHLKASVRCASYRGESAVRAPCRWCGKYIANNEWSMEQHAWYCRGNPRPASPEKRDKRDRSRTPISRSRTQTTIRTSRTPLIARDKSSASARSRTPVTPVRLAENNRSQRSSHSKVSKGERERSQSRHQHRKSHHGSSSKGGNGGEGSDEKKKNLAAAAPPPTPPAPADPLPAMLSAMPQPVVPPGGVIQPLSALLLGVAGLLQQQPQRPPEPRQ